MNNSIQLPNKQCAGQISNVNITKFKISYFCMQNYMVFCYFIIPLYKKVYIESLVKLISKHYRQY